MRTRRTHLATLALSTLALVFGPAFGRLGPSQALPPGAPDAASGPDAAKSQARPPSAAARRAASGPRPGFGVQYWGDGYTADDLAAAPHCTLIIEASTHGADAGPGFREVFFSAEEVARIRRNGSRPTFAYLSVAKLARHRDYWTTAFGAGAPAPVSGGAAPAWYGTSGADGASLAAYWTQAWAALLRARIDVFLAAGYDGVFLDDVLLYYDWGGLEATPGGPGVAPRSAADFAAAMMKLVLDLSRYARETAPQARPGFGVIVNGGAYIGWDAAARDGASAMSPHALFEPYLDAIDGVAIESALSRADGAATIDALRQGYLAHGVPVLAIDYFSLQEGVPLNEFRDRMLRAGAAHGFFPYVALDERLAALEPPLLAPAGSSATATARCLSPEPDARAAGPR